MAIESSGSSLVKIEGDQVFQIFKSSKVAERVANIAIKLLSSPYITYRVLLQKGFGSKKQIFIDEEIKYNAFDYIVPFEYWIKEDDIIVWKKIFTLNSMKDRYLFLSENWIKLMYDIMKGLYALKTIGIIHNDTVIDNIGIYKDNFVLFDFDGSGTPEEKGKDFSNDIKTLINSFKFYDIKVPEIYSISEMVSYYANTFSKSYSESLHILENLKIKQI